MCDLQIYICANRTNQDANLEEFHSPVYLTNSLGITVALTAVFGLTPLLIDITNAYQNTLLVLAQMFYIYPPPFYIE